MNSSRILGTIACLTVLFTTPASLAVDIASTTKALRLANTITGGLMPTSDPLFTQMVTKVQAGDLTGAANIAANSPYFATYMARRLALQMQGPALDASVGTDDDATAFLVAHFVGTPTTKPSISTIWSENATYMVNVGGTNMHASALTATQLATVNWTSSLVQVSGQNAVNTAGAAVMIPQKHVGGYITLSSQANDNSFAQYGATAGTNLRMIEGIWEIGTGLSLLDMASPNSPASNAPRFVPEYDPNFFHGQGQTACISCHGGGMSSVDHGYATVADVFDFGTKGLVYIATPTPATMKSLASDPTKRTDNAACNLTKTATAVCNPDSVGVGTANAWDVSQTWSSNGILNKMGWSGPTTGQGLNALGSALGQATIVYEFMTKRVVQEVCPLGEFSADDVTRIAAAANPYASPAGTDDVRTIVAMVATQETCQ